MKDLGLWLSFIFVDSWKTVMCHLTGKRHPTGGHMAGFGNALELFISYLAVIIQILLIIVVGLIIR